MGYFKRSALSAFFVLFIFVQAVFAAEECNAESGECGSTDDLEAGKKKYLPQGDSIALSIDQSELDLDPDSACGPAHPINRANPLFI